VCSSDLTPGVRARLPQVLGTTGQVVWVTDALGEDALEFAPTTGSAPGVEPRRVGAGELGRVLELVASPDGRKVALVTHDGRLLLVDVASGSVDELARAENDEPDGLVFSPDSAWLAWSHPGRSPLRNIKLASVADRGTVDVTDDRFIDTSPAFTLDGKHLAFLSERTFDPIYDVHVFDLSFPVGTRPHLVPLGALTPSPFAPLREGRGFGGADPGADGDPDTPADPSDSSDPGDKSDPPRTVVDVDGLTERAVAFPVAAARYSTLVAAKGGVLWLRDPVTGRLGDDLAEGDPGPR
jgi:tricorn protease